MDSVAGARFDARPRRLRVQGIVRGGEPPSLLELPGERSGHMKTLAELQTECAALGIEVEVEGRASKEPFIAALQAYHWQKDHPGQPLPAQVMPMLLSDWVDLTPDQAQEIEQDNHAWVAQPMLEAPRLMLHEEGSHLQRPRSPVVITTIHPRPCRRK